MTLAAKPRRILVWENNGQPGMGVASELLRRAPHGSLEVVTVASREAALGRLQAQPFAVVVMDVGRESGEAQDLLRAIGYGFPSLPLFIFNGFLIPGIAEKALEYEQARYCEDPNDLERFILLVLGELGSKKRGTIEGVRLTNFIDWLNHEGLSGQVAVSSGSKKGVLYFQEGRLAGASLDDDPGERKALAEISTWERVTVEIREGSIPEGAAAGASTHSLPLKPSSRAEGGGRDRQGTGDIEVLRLAREGGNLDVRIGDLRRVVDSVRSTLGDSLLRLDIFLSADGRSLVGWNSHPLACSAFAAITRILAHALEASRFPKLGNYYLVDLAEGQLALVMVCGELQVGMLLARGGLPMGRLTHIVLPDTAKALARSYTVEHPA